MRKLFDRLSQSLAQFLTQRDDLLLLVPCADDDVALLLKALRDLDRRSPAALFLLFNEDFTAADAYVSGLADRLQQELTLTNEATGPEAEKLPPLPADFLNPAKPAPDRLRAGLTYGRSLVDPAKGQRHVWGMGPMAIGDPKSYLALLAALAPRPDILPWMRGARVVARVPADFQLDASPLAGAKRVRVEPFVIPPTAHEDELLAVAGDPKVPLGERMQAEVQLAYLDCAHSRLEEATERFRKALAFFQWAGVPAMQGLIICGLGDVARRRNDLKQAQHWYACATVPAAEAGSPILLATVVQHLAALAYQEQRWPDAEERYGELVTIKRGMLDEVGLAEALEWRGLSQEKQGAYDRAVVTFHEAALVCEAFEMKDRMPPMLTHLRQGYQKLGMREELENFEAEWSA
jgi:tetratricopeptide (TPR) repeat protein